MEHAFPLLFYVVKLNCRVYFDIVTAANATDHIRTVMIKMRANA